MKHPFRNPHQWRGAARSLPVGLTLALGVSLGVAPAGAVQPSRAALAAAPVKAEVKLANAALAQAVTRFQAHDKAGTIAALKTVKSHTRTANANAIKLIGAPPVDPESDDAPGPPAVLAAVNLDAKITKTVLPFFNGTTGPKLVKALRNTLVVAQNQRDSVLDPVLALPAEGDGADYADGMTDTLPAFQKEVKSLTTALATFTLTTGAKTGLTNALARAKATNAKVKKVWGGGERPLARP